MIKKKIEVLIVIILTFLHFRYITIDEGGVPFLGDSDQRSYIPSKPHPNCIEYFVAVDMYYYVVRLLWDKPTLGQKYTRPKEMFELIKRFITHFNTFSKGRRGSHSVIHLLYGCKIFKLGCNEVDMSIWLSMCTFMFIFNEAK